MPVPGHGTVSRRRDSVIGQAHWAIKATLPVAITTEFRAGASHDHLIGGKGPGLLCPASSTGPSRIDLGPSKPEKLSAGRKL